MKSNGWIPRNAHLSLAAVAVSALSACSEAPQPPEVPAIDSAEYRSQIESWRAERDGRLRKPDGWLSLAGLYWLEEGDNLFGSAESNQVVFPAGRIEERAGVLTRRGREVTLAAGERIEFAIGDEPVEAPTLLSLDTSKDGPTIVETGSLSFYAIERGEMIGIRLKDSENPVLAGFDGMKYFPIDEGWRLTGRYVLFDEPRTLKTPNVLGTVSEEQILGEVQFEVGGEVHSLQPSGEPADGFFLVFGDTTNTVETYGGGRFLYTEPVQADGSVVIDFNKAYCPPCVFTPFATCPLPPAANKLGFRIEAGEKMFGAVH